MKFKKIKTILLIGITLSFFNIQYSFSCEASKVMPKQDFWSFVQKFKESAYKVNPAILAEYENFKGFKTDFVKISPDHAKTVLMQHEYYELDDKIIMKALFFSGLIEQSYIVANWQHADVFLKLKVANKAIDDFKLSGFCVPLDLKKQYQLLDEKYSRGEDWPFDFAGRSPDHARALLFLHKNLSSELRLHSVQMSGLVGGLDHSMYMRRDPNRDADTVIRANFKKWGGLGAPLCDLEKAPDNSLGETSDAVFEALR